MVAWGFEYKNKVLLHRSSNKLIIVMISVCVAERPIDRRVAPSDACLFVSLSNFYRETVHSTALQ